MSKWIEGSMELTCNIDVLCKTLKEIKPEWSDGIIVSQEGLPLYRYNGKKIDNDQGGGIRKANIIIPGGGNPNSQIEGRKIENDWGFCLDGEGNWKTIFADYNLEGAEKLKKQLVAKVTEKKILHLASQNKCQITSIHKKNGEKTIDIKIDLEKFSL